MKNKIFIPLVLIVTFITVILSSSIYPFIKHNGIGGGYDEGEDTREMGTQSIESYIIEGSGYYLGANSDMQKLLAMVELQDIRGIDYPAVQKILNSAMDKMQKAKEIYGELIEKAEATPYNNYVILLLRYFDYETFRAENDLNETIFERVREKLQAGNITGILKITYSDYKKIIGLLYEINLSVSRNELPGLPLFRKLDRTLASSSLFGSYTAGIFSELLPTY